MHLQVLHECHYHSKPMYFISSQMNDCQITDAMHMSNSHRTNFMNFISTDV